ncbi:MAG: cytochrome-c peroxidase [Sphingobacteriales bacterium]|nr:MAG: cytochrome-c peroxidase [Sphingobacteriales bacterium]
MKRIILVLLPLALLVTTAATLDLASLHNYANQARPAYIRKDNTPQGNAIDDKGATLGRVLFYDKKLSLNNTVSCGSCHHQQFAFGDTASASKGAQGNTSRHTMRLVNIRFGTETRFFWDERALSLEEQTTLPIQNHEEMGYSGQNGDPTINDLIAKMNSTWYYPRLFSWAYGDAQITEQRMQQALSKFIRSIQSLDSKFDVGRAAVNNDNAPFPNYTQQENQGKQLFLAPPQFNANGIRIAGGAGCAGCHRAPEFDIDPNSRNNGVTGSFSGVADRINTRSPSLRDIVDINGIAYGGFMHNAGANGLNTLLDVINHYDSIPAANPNLDPRLRPGGNLQRLRMTMQEKEAMVAFLSTLTGSDIYTNPKWSDPFTNDSLDATNLPGLSVSSTNTGNKLKVYPTIVTDGIISIDGASTNMQITNTEGRTMYRGAVNARMDIAAYPTGIYMIRFDNGQTERIIKQ